ncbi:zinc finger protein 446 isoform X5 [Marmota monax]|uniref:zinc finger protein 446 isoform X5 n=1 Tax=Marmota monax TaxID=9995 RepID=UPI0026EC0DB6|nr:zinc finger protein 446 isoform X5 [Marmota monax]
MRSSGSRSLLVIPKRPSETRMPSPLRSPHQSLSNLETTLEEPEAARLKFRGFCYKEVAGPREALTRLRELCRQWLRPESCSKEQMLELLVLEQFVGTLPPEIQSWVQGQRPGSPEEAVALVEGLQHDPGQLLGWITAHILKPEVLPAAQKTEESSASPCPSGTVEFSGAAPGEGPHNARMEGSTQLSCSVKEEPSADGQHHRPVHCFQLSLPRGILDTRTQPPLPSTHPGFRRRGGCWTHHRRSSTGTRCWRSTARWSRWQGCHPRQPKSGLNPSQSLTVSQSWGHHAPDPSASSSQSSLFTLHHRHSSACLPLIRRTFVMTLGPLGCFSLPFQATFTLKWNTITTYRMGCICNARFMGPQ